MDLLSETFKFDNKLYGKIYLTLFSIKIVVVIAIRLIYIFNPSIIILRIRNFRTHSWRTFTTKKAPEKRY